MSVHALDGSSYEPAGPEKIEASNERIAVVHLVREEEVEEAASEKYRNRERRRHDGGADNPYGSDEGDCTPAEVRRDVRNSVVVLDVTLIFLRLRILQLHEPLFFVIDWIAIFGDFDRSWLTLNERDVVAVRYSPEGSCAHGTEPVCLWTEDHGMAAVNLL